MTVNNAGAPPPIPEPPEPPKQPAPPQPQPPQPPNVAPPPVNNTPGAPVPPQNSVIVSVPNALSLPTPGGAPDTGGKLNQFNAEFDAASKATGIPVPTLKAVAWAESRADPNVAGGGMMQLDWTPAGAFNQMKDKHPNLVKGDINDAGSNIMAGALYLKEQQDKFGSMGAALRAYNSGPNGIDVNNLNATPAGTGDPDYVNKVMRFSATLEKGGALPP